MEEVFAYLRGLRNEDFCDEEDFGERSFDGEYNRIDGSYSKGNRVVVETGFTNVLDLHRAEIDKVVLVGNFNLVDVSMAKIKVLDKKKANISIFDAWRAKIQKGVK
jgi:hypothetical protein